MANDDDVPVDDRSGRAGDPVRLAVWSGPRNISTAMMRSWENRPDSIVVDEPLYAHFLAVTGIDHPGREEVLAAGQTSWQVAVDSLLGPVPTGVRVFYSKQMAHHLIGDASHAWIASLTNVLLIRDPREVVASYVRSRADVTLADIGVEQLVAIDAELTALGQPPRVIDSSDFLRSPESYLRGLCAMIGLPFYGSMLAWPPGPRATDGVWAPYWYDAVLASTGFAPYRPRRVELSGHDAEVAAAAEPLYRGLWERRWVSPDPSR